MDEKKYLKWYNTITYNISSYLSMVFVYFLYFKQKIQGWKSNSHNSASDTAPCPVGIDNTLSCVLFCWHSNILSIAILSYWVQSKRPLYEKPQKSD